MNLKVLAFAMIVAAVVIHVFSADEAPETLKNGVSLNVIIPVIALMSGLSLIGVGIQPMLRSVAAFRNRHTTSESLSPAALKSTAVHEAGHAAAQLLYPETFAPPSISIGSHVADISKNSGETTVENIEQTGSETSLRHDIIADLSGREAQVLILGEATEGAVADIKNATQTAKFMVEEYGMGKLTGTIAIGELTNVSPDLQARINQDVEDILRECRLISQKLLKQNISGVKALATVIETEMKIDGERAKKVFESAK